ncbi:MAG: class I SAM-dependent methyltransferase [Acidimicrobiaceae bacterium]|nr:class I SAM-dependent methyltransferase [Acidimicrobiaceae bacterium]
MTSGQKPAADHETKKPLTNKKLSAQGDRYVDLLMGCLTRELFLAEETHDVDLSEWPGNSDELRSVLKANGWHLTKQGGEPEARAEGHDWPPTAETMVGRQRLADVRRCVDQVMAEDVPGDFIETGVWRGGVTILMKGMLEAWEDTRRRVWVADSFSGLPVPNVETYPADEGHDMSDVKALHVTADEVRANFDRYGLLDERVCFLEGWFADTLATAPIEQLAILRLDGDLYESTTDALTALYPKLSVGGYVLVDDYGAWEPCRAAVDDYRAAHKITDEIVHVDWTGVHWQRST